jgi:small subunit ribosomal protein S21
MIIVPVKEGENIEKALRNRQAFEKPSVTNRKKMMRAIYIQKLQQIED